MANELSVFEIINEISKDIGLDGDKTVIEIEKTDNPDIKKLNLMSGSWSAKEPSLLSMRIKNFIL